MGVIFPEASPVGFFEGNAPFSRTVLQTSSSSLLLPQTSLAVGCGSLCVLLLESRFPSREFCRRWALPLFKHAPVPFSLFALSGSPNARRPSG